MKVLCRGCKIGPDAMFDEKHCVPMGDGTFLCGPCAIKHATYLYESCLALRAKISKLPAEAKSKATPSGSSVSV